MLHHRILMTFIAICVFFSPAKAEELTREKKADIEQLLIMTGALSLGKQMSAAVVENFVETLKHARPDIPQDVLNILQQEIAATFDENIDSLKDEMIPLYHKYFTSAELKEMIRFYSTDLGKKTIKVMPNLLQEGMAVGHKWGQSLAPKINKRVANKLRQQGVQI